MKYLCRLCHAPAVWIDKEQVWRHAELPPKPIICDKYGYSIPVETISDDKCPVCGNQGCSNCRIDLANAEISRLRKDQHYRDVSRYEWADGLGIRVIVAGLKRDKLSEREDIALNKAVDLIEAAIREEDLARDPVAIAHRAETRKKMLEAFPEHFAVEEIPNEYVRHWWTSQQPWFRILTRIGWFKVGWRKRVINLDWTETVRRKSGAELFPEHEGTKSQPSDPERYIHASDYDYLAKLVQTIIAATSGE